MRDGAVVLDHPLIRHKLSRLRDRRTGKKRFRELVDEIASLMVYEATRDLVGERTTVETPLGRAQGERLREDRVVVVPVLRAGLGMAEAFLRLVPGARVGHLGFFRDEETLEPVRYYAKTPPGLERAHVFVLDPMLGTGGTASAAIRELKERGAADVRLLCLVAAPEGVARVRGDHADVPLLTAALDRRLGDSGYILPGLGDAGDRLFGT